jgi:hypothetical protein
MVSLSNFIELCGELFHKFDSRSEHIDTFRLLILFLYYRSGSNTFIASKLNESINGAELHREQHLTPEIDCMCKLWFKLIKDYGNPSLLAPNEGPEIIDRFYRAVKFNAQSLPVPNVPATSILCLFDCVSKLNHSCRPNAQILYNNAGGVVRAHVVATTDIARGAEICISYLSALGLPVDSRRQLLQQAFHFRCECCRCINEANHIQAIFMFPSSSDVRSLHALISSSIDDDILVGKNVGAFVSLLKHGVLEGMLADGESLDRSVDAYRVYDFAIKAFVILRTQLQRLSASSSNENSVIILKCHLIQISHILSNILSAFGSEYSNDRLMIIIYGVGIASKVRPAEIKDNDIMKAIHDIISEANRVLNFSLSVVGTPDSCGPSTAARTYQQFKKTVELVRVLFGDF